MSYRPQLGDEVLIETAGPSRGLVVALRPEREQAVVRTGAEDVCLPWVVLQPRWQSQEETRDAA